MDDRQAFAVPAHTYELTLDKLIDHGAKWHGTAEVVTGAGAETTPSRVTYAELRNRAKRISGTFLQWGLRPGDRIASLAWNSQSHVEFWFAAFGTGISCHTLNPRLSEEQLAAMIDQAADRVLAVSPDLLPLARALSKRCRTIEKVVLLEEPGALRPEGAGGTVDASLSSLAAMGSPADWGGFSELTEAGLCFTSGTTGAPKGVPYTHRCNYLIAMSLMQRDVMGIGAQDVILAAVPMFHANGWGLALAAPAAGAKLVLPASHNDGASLARLIRDEGVTLAVGVATVWLGLIEHVERTGERFPSLERVLLGGAGVPQALVDRIEARLGVMVQTSWGMTELAPIGTVSLPGRSGDASAAGRPPLGVDLMVTDAEGAPLPEQTGTEGHLKVRGSSAIEKYLDSQKSAVDEDGWFDTGDLAIIDKNGNLSITGRTKDLIKSGGEWINPGVIERIVGALAGVSSVAVVGREDPKWSERPVLVIEGREAPNDAALRKALTGQIPRWWMPDSIERVETMPLAATGKIDKRVLRQRFGGARIS